MRVQLCVLSLSATIAGCAALNPSGDPIPVDDEVSAYFPLTMGSWWTYQVQDLAKDWKYEQRVIVTSRGIVHGLDPDTAVVEEAYSSDDVPFFESTVEPMAYLWKEGYLQRIFLTRRNRQFVPVDGFAESKVLPRTLVPGMTWTGPGVSFQLGSRSGFRVRNHHYITVEEEPVKVPRGSFAHCIRVDTISRHGKPMREPRSEVTFYYSDWYAPGVGLVRSEAWDDRARTRKRVSLELVNFEIVDEPGTKYQLATTGFESGGPDRSAFGLAPFLTGTFFSPGPPA